MIAYELVERKYRDTILQMNKKNSVSLVTEIHHSLIYNLSEM